LKKARYSLVYKTILFTKRKGFKSLEEFGVFSLFKGLLYVLGR